MPRYVQAFLFGALSAASLPLGAVLGVWLRPSSRVIAGVMSLGAGALLAALTLELVGPALDRAGFAPLALGIAGGCAAFTLLNAALERQGAFMRKAATAAHYVRRRKYRHLRGVIGKLSRVDMLRRLPPHEVQGIAPHVQERSFPAGAVVFHQGDPGDSLYLIESGSVAIIRHDNDAATTLAVLGEGDTFGEMALLSGEPRTADAVAVDAVRAWRIGKDDFDRLLRASPALEQAVVSLADERKGTPARDPHPDDWAASAADHLDPAALRPTRVEIHHTVQEHGGHASAALAIWLGACLDGAGEAVVIGATTIGAGVSLPLVGGVLLANLPESMSSAAAMSRQGAGKGRILAMWLSLVVVTGIAAGAGNLLLTGASPALFALLEGAAAGAMLAMAAQTMLPEAFELGGGAAIGVLTVAGFLAAIFIRSLNGTPGH
ncbi:MAG: cyclic nucleotide-binding domain-containing protein [Armatimonadetes bacterium]|nr:cyclic nucleotide-binding domain-containing protein [Armatimonadota bacterium]